MVLAYIILNHIFLKYIMISHYIYIDSSVFLPKNELATKLKIKWNMWRKIENLIKI